MRKVFYVLAVLVVASVVYITQRSVPELSNDQPQNTEANLPAPDLAPDSEPAQEEPTPEDDLTGQLNKVLGAATDALGQTVDEAGQALTEAGNAASDALGQASEATVEALTNAAGAASDALGQASDALDVGVGGDEESGGQGE